MEIDKRVNPLKKSYTEDQVTKDNQKYIVYMLEALVKQEVAERRLTKIGVSIKEVTEPTINCSKALIARLITPQLIDLSNIVSIIDWWVTKKVDMMYDSNIVRIMYKDRIDVTEMEEFLVYLYNI